MSDTLLEGIKINKPENKFLVRFDASYLDTDFFLN